MNNPTSTQTGRSAPKEFLQGAPMRKMSRRGPILGLSVLLGLVLSGCANNAELDTLKPQGPSANSINNLLVPVMIVAGVVFLIVFGIVAVISVKFRDKHDSDELDFPEQIHGHLAAEITWTIVPAVIMAVIGVGTLIVHIDINSTKANAMEIQVEGTPQTWEPTVVVVGQQWWWEYRYYLSSDITAADLKGVSPKELPPADIVTSGQMVVPAGQEIELIVTSRDVIHSHWIPALNGKRDAVPGRYNPWKIEADNPGVYFGQCTEFCGLSHARMRMQVVAVTDGEFQDWIDTQMQPAAVPAGAEELVAAYRNDGAATLPDNASAAARGVEAFISNCTSCHLINGVNDLSYTGANQVSGAAPNLTHLASRTTFAGALLNLYNADGSLNRDDLSAWLRNPAALKDNAATDPIPRGMPNLGLSENTISDLVAYLSTLGPKPTMQQIQQTQVN